MALKSQLLVRVHPARARRFGELLADACIRQALVEAVNHCLVLETSLRDHQEHGLGDPHQAVKHAEGKPLLAVARPVLQEPFGLSDIVAVPWDDTDHCTRKHHALLAAAGSGMIVAPSGQLIECLDAGPLAHTLDDLSWLPCPPLRPRWGS